MSCGKISRYSQCDWKVSIKVKVFMWLSAKMAMVCLRRMVSSIASLFGDVCFQGCRRHWREIVFRRSGCRWCIDHINADVVSNR